MTKPRSLEALRDMRSRPKRSQGAQSAFEETLDALLSQPETEAATDGGGTMSGTERSPLDRLRDLFSEELIPLVESVAQRYADKGVCVRMDASDFVAGGRGLCIEIEFKDHRLCMDGTVMEDAIAFNETRFSSESGGIVVGGPTLRTRRLTAKVFGDYLYDRIIKLVKSTNR